MGNYMVIQDTYGPSSLIRCKGFEQIGIIKPLLKVPDSLSS